MKLPRIAAFVVGSAALAAGGSAGACDPVPVKALAPVAAARAAPAGVPFRYLGRVIQDGKLEVLLARGNEHFSAAVGDRVGADHRVEAVTDGEVVLLYLPLNTRQRLR